MSVSYFMTIARSFLKGFDYAQHQSPTPQNPPFGGVLCNFMGLPRRVLSGAYRINVDNIFYTDIMATSPRNTPVAVLSAMGVFHFHLPI